MMRGIRNWFFWPPNVYEEKPSPVVRRVITHPRNHEEAVVFLRKKYPHSWQNMSDFADMYVEPMVYGDLDPDSAWAEHTKSESIFAGGGSRIMVEGDIYA